MIRIIITNAVMLQLLIIVMRCAVYRGRSSIEHAGEPQAGREGHERPGCVH